MSGAQQVKNILSAFSIHPMSNLLSKTGHFFKIMLKAHSMSFISTPTTNPTEFLKRDMENLEGDIVTTQGKYPLLVSIQLTSYFLYFPCLSYFTSFKQLKFNPSHFLLPHATHKQSVPGVEIPFVDDKICLL